jgi:peptidoglycan hydrolase CwlO-like protein
MNRKFVVAILLVAAVSVCAHAQNPRVSEGDAEKVATIISGDNVKTQAYCDIHKLAKQVADANEKKDDEKVNELLEKIDKLEKTLGPEYVALVEGIQDIAENDQLRAEFSSAFGALVRLCTR